MVIERASTPYVILGSEDFRVLGPDEFGSAGLKAVESIGPFVDIQASGPLITVHDATVDPHLGIGHHPHRYNERLFYILEGELDHDDRLNGIRGHMDAGDVGLFTEGRGGMVHSEWNNGDVPAKAFILVYSTSPVPEKTLFTVLSDAEAPRYQEGEGVATKELVGPRSGLRVHGDIRFVADTRLTAGTGFGLELAEGEGGLLSVRSGRIKVGADQVRSGEILLLPPAEERRDLRVEAVEGSRVIRVIHGPGHGFIRRSDGR